MLFKDDFPSVLRNLDGRLVSLCFDSYLVHEKHHKMFNFVATNKVFYSLHYGFERSFEAFKMTSDKAILRCLLIRQIEMNFFT